MSWGILAGVQWSMVTEDVNKRWMEALYSDRKPLENFEHKSDMIWVMIFKRLHWFLYLRRSKRESRYEFIAYHRSRREMVVAWIKVAARYVCRKERGQKWEQDFVYEIIRKVSLDRKRGGPRIKPWILLGTLRDYGTESKVSQKNKEKIIFKVKTSETVINATDQVK